MNSFGLGLVLNFTDNASSGMNRVSQSFNQMNGLATKMVDSSDSAVFSIESLTAAGMGLSIVGEQLSSVGNSIVSVFTGASQAIIDSGLEIQSYRMQLNALYGSAEAGEAKMDEIKQYAMSSVFEIQSLIPAVTTMKAVGIEAMEEITTSSGQHTQKLLDYAADLAAMMPNMRNTYGTGVQAAMGAFKEYIAEGNALSLKRGAGLDITQILGEDKGATVEERTRQVADLIEHLNIVGYTANLAGTPMQRMSNMQDALYNTLTKIADSGVFEVYCGLLEKLSNWIFTLVEDEETFNTITGILADTITTILSPLSAILDFLIANSNAIISWVKENPKLTKTILVVVAAIGALLVAGGTLLKLGGSFFMVTSSLMQMSNLASKGISIFNIFGRSIGIFASKLLPIVGIAALIYTAWSNNLFGIRDIVTKVFKDITETLALVFDAFGDNTLSVDKFEKAKEMGILPLIETILDLKYRFEFFKQGFVKGWNDISATIVAVFGKIASVFKGSVFEPLIEKISGFFTRLASTDTSIWTKMGESVGKFAGIAVVITPVVKLIVSLSSKLKGLIPIVKGIFSLIGAHPVIAIIVGVIAGLVALYTKCEEFRNFVNGLFSEIGAIFKDSFGNILTTLKEAFITLTPTIGILKQSFLSFLPQVGEFLKQIATFLAGIIGKVVELAGRLLPVIVQIMTTVMNAVFKLLPVLMEIGSVVMDVISNLIMPLVMDLIDMIIPFIVQMAELVSELIDSVLPIVIGLIESIVPVIMDLVAVLIPMIKNILDAVKPIIQVVLNIVTTIMAKLVPVLKNLFNIAADIIKMVINIAVPIITVVMQIVEVIVAVLMPIIEVLLEVIGFIIDVILGIVEVVVAVVAFIVKIITGIVNVIVSILNVIIQFIMSAVAVVVGIVTTIIDTITGIISGIIKVVQFIWDSIVAVFSGVIDFFAGIFGAVFDTVTGVFQSIGEFFTNVWNGIVGAFSKLGDTISGAIKGAINGVLSGAVGIVNGFIHAINFAIGIINAIPGVSISKINLLEVPQLAEGGVVDKPTTAIIGEAGQEAVVPLENNTEWTDKIANKLAPKLSVEKAQSSSETAPQEVHNDYSVTFSAGSIVIQLANATEAELEKAAEKLMKIIERKQQLKKMAVRV